MNGQFWMWLICILGGFSLGGIMFCQVIPKVFLGVDICAVSDDHNPGATNVFINCGPRWGALCLTLDLLKGVIPVWFAIQHLPVYHPMFALVLAAPVLGHAMAPFLQFHGGKCIATAFGEMLGLYSVCRIGLLLAGLYILFSTVVPIHPNRIRSIVTFVLFGTISLVLLFTQQQMAIGVGCGLIALIVTLKHTKYFAATEE